jgi:hypothetical protein
MALVDLRIAPSTLKKALDDLLNDTNVSSYTITLANSGGVIAGLSDTCTFAVAQYDSTNKQAYIQLDDPVYFYVDSGTTIDRLNLYATVITPSGTKVILSGEEIETREYTANGTYTVSDLIVRIGE